MKIGTFCFADLFGFKTRGLWLSEAVMLELDKRIGRQTAHDLVYQCAMKSVEKRRPFSDTLLAEPAVARHLPREQIESLLDPLRYTGLCGPFVDRVLARFDSEISPSSDAPAHYSPS